MEAKSAPPAADKHEEPTVAVMETSSSTPIELLAEATQLAREALAHHAKTQALHASNPNDPAPDSSSSVPPARENEAAGVPTDVGGYDAEKRLLSGTAAAGESPGASVGASTVAVTGTKAVAPPLIIPTVGTGSGSVSGNGTHDDAATTQRDTLVTTTPPSERKTPPPDEMVISPVVATPHPNIGSKRTASGAIKAPSTSLPATPYQPATSSPRNGRERIGELSTQLRSRLSYAMIKMQNGLQGQSFDQVENYIVEKRQNRLSQSPSITASNTPLIPPATIGHTQTVATSQPLKRQTSVDSYSGGLGISLIPSPAPASPRTPHTRVGRHSRTTSDPSAMFLGPAANINSQQDPNYWVKPPPSPLPSNVRGSGQGPSQAVDSFAARFQMSPGRHLAPAAPIRHHGRSPSGSHTLPTRRGRLPPPSLPKTFSNMSSVSNISSAPTDIISLAEEPLSSSQPAAVRPCTPVRTNTLTMEQDAVESLMFLSSPGHSQHRGSRPASRSAVSTHQPQFQSQLIQQIWNGGPTDQEGDSFMETAASTTVDDEEVRLVEEDDELDRELDRQRKNQEYGEPDIDHELRREANGLNSSVRTPQQGRGDHTARVKRVKTMEEMLSAAERADAAAHWQYKSSTADTPAAAPVAPSPMLSG
ncbi:hypothetical protein TWF730_010971 [Orbilia blumenaviensis]|uniref:Uncharacterized protein n=1 Tax=Orbilia blumenaviensis TaxID=1796055 RepID=A0AAV9UJC2_9PEZI